MLVGMHVRERRQRIATIDVREIYEWCARTSGIDGGDRTLVEVDRASVQVGGSVAVGNGEQFEVVESLVNAAAFAVAGAYLCIGIAGYVLLLGEIRPVAMPQETSA